MLSQVKVEKLKKDEPYKQEVYSHQIFNSIGDIVKNIDKLAFEQCKDLIGKSLREDFSDLNN